MKRSFILTKRSLLLIDRDKLIRNSPYEAGKIVIMSIYFRKNINDGIHVNPSRTNRSTTPHITSMYSDTVMGRNRNSGWNIGDVIPPINIGSFSLFDRVTSDLA